MSVWTDEEDRRLKALARMGIREVMHALPGRSRQAIWRHANKIGVKIRKDPKGGGAWQWRGRIPIPEHAHPLVRKFFGKLNNDGVLVKELAERAGLDAQAVSHWRYTCNPRLDNFIAALNVLDLDLAIVHRAEER